MLIGLLLCFVYELPTASGPKSARVYCGYRPGPPVWHLHPGKMMEEPERHLLRAWFVWLCKWLPCRCAVVVTLPLTLCVCPHPSSTDSLSRGVGRSRRLRPSARTRCSTAAVAAVFSKLTWHFRLDVLCSRNRTAGSPHSADANPLDWLMRLISSCSQRQWNLIVYKAGYLVTVRSVKYDISPLMDSPVRVCTAIRYSELADTTEVKLLSRQHFVQHSGTLLFQRRQRQSVSIHSCCSTRFCVDFHISDEDNQVIDSLRGGIPVRGCTVLNGIPQRQHAALVPQLVSDTTVLLFLADHDVWRLGPADN